MKIAFYAPLKPADHPAPSGDRQMARLLIKALQIAGHDVEIASRLRSFIPDNLAESLTAIRAEADAETQRIATDWKHHAAPDLWFCYHPYYKAPDLIGPQITRAFGIPYIAAEASYSGRRNCGIWAKTQATVVDAIKQARLTLCFTSRDHDGLRQIAPDARLAMLAPFIDSEGFVSVKPAHEPAQLISVAMMRKGDKFDSFEMLAQALALLGDLPWSLTVIGDGPLRAEVMALFGELPPDRLTWAGEVSPGGVRNYLETSAIYVWPGCGEAYGLAYLEAQAAGLPVVAQHTAGVPEVVRADETGILTPAGDVAAFAAAVRQLLTNTTRRQAMSRAARRFVVVERSLAVAAERLSRHIDAALAGQRVEQR